MNQLLSTPITMSSLEIADLTRKEHKNVKRDIEAIFRSLELDALNFEHIYKDTRNRLQISYALPKDLVQTLIVGYSINLRYKVIQRLNNLENHFYVNSLLPHDFPSALRALADTHEQLQINKLQLDQALKTKAQISDRKTATAMATASNAIQENQKLKDQLGQSVKLATIQAVQNLTGIGYNWRLLKAWCKANDCEVFKVVDIRYGQVNSYPALAWLETFNIDLKKLFGGVK